MGLYAQGPRETSRHWDKFLALRFYFPKGLGHKVRWEVDCLALLSAALRIFIAELLQQPVCEEAEGQSRWVSYRTYRWSKTNAEFLPPSWLSPHQLLLNEIYSANFFRYYWEIIFMYLLAFLISSLKKKCLFRSFAIFFNWVIWFFCFCCRFCYWVVWVLLYRV